MTRYSIEYLVSITGSESAESIRLKTLISGSDLRQICSLRDKKRKLASKSLRLFTRMNGCPQLLKLRPQLSLVVILLL
jgi:hypothetical protein